MILYVLDSDLTIIATVDDYESLIWRVSYYNAGDFELYLNATPDMINLLRANRYLVKSTDASVDSDGKFTYTNVMIIKNVTVTTAVDDADQLTVTGRELKYVLHQRIVWSQTNLTGAVENGLRSLVNQNAINPSDTKRVIPNLMLGAVSGLTDAIDKQITGDFLDDAISDICITYGYGWDIYIYDKKMVFIVYAGVNRSYEQTDRPYVVFSDDFDNILNSEYVMNTESYCSTALIGGEGEGTDRVFTSLNTSLTGLNRYELFVDAKDISSNNGEITRDDYIKLLNERGLNKLSELNYTEAFTGEVMTDGSFTYNVDFFVGDIVTVINKYGISKNVRVLSAIESHDGDGVKLIPQFGF